MSSIVTAVPTGLVPAWCLMVPWFGSDLQQCANSTQSESDFETFCCDGSIIDTTQDLFSGTARHVYMEDLMCCRIEGPQAGGIMPLPDTGNTMCDSGATAVPLTSLAATNTDNAQDYLVTYTSASFGGPTPGDFIPTETPYCFWAYTKSGVQLTTITVPAPEITTLSSSTFWGDDDFQSTAGLSDTLSGSQTPTTGVSSTRTTTHASSSTTATPSATTSSGAASGPILSSGNLLRMLGGLAIGLFY